MRTRALMRCCRCGGCRSRAALPHPRDLAQLCVQAFPELAAPVQPRSIAESGLVGASDFSKQQYCRRHQLSFWQQAHSNASRTMKLHIRDVDNYVTCVSMRCGAQAPVAVIRFSVPLDGHAGRGSGRVSKPVSSLVPCFTFSVMQPSRASSPSSSTWCKSASSSTWWRAPWRLTARMCVASV
jgi:hypothetical protein